MTIIFVGVAALAGGLAVSVLGYLQGTNKWSWRKFGASFITSVIGAAGISAVVDISGAISPVLYIVAFLSGAGVDAGRSRIAGSIRRPTNGG